MPESSPSRRAERTGSPGRAPESPPESSDTHSGGGSGATICFITPGHLASNPRLVKEAAAASEAGYDVHVVFNQYFREVVCDHDAEILSDHPEWTVECVDWMPATWSGAARRLWTGARQRVARRLFDATGWEALAPWAQSRTYAEMLRAARRHPADLYVAHNLSALPVAARAARERGVRFGFDAEDYHRGELSDTPENRSRIRLRRTVEERFMPEADYVTAASDGIAEAYEQAVGIDRPTTILNVFRWEERTSDCSPEELAAETPDDGVSIYWFSQVIGPNRGLEDALRALPHLPDDTVLTLRGTWIDSYREAFMREAETLGVAHRVRSLGRVPASELVERTGEHDVGLAIERPGESRNRDVCVSNKLFTYLIAGVPFAATCTEGQAPFCERIPNATRCYSAGHPRELARSIQELLDAPDASDAALRAARERYNWRVEKTTFLTVVGECLQASK